MRNRVLIMVLCCVCVFVLGGCSHNKTLSNNVEENNSAVESEAKDESKVADDSSTNDEVGNVKEENQDTEANKKDVVDLSDEDIDAAKKVVKGYYANTVFVVNSITYIEPGTNANAEGECNFMVNVSKDGEVQEPDRMISLNRKDNTWEIINEGY
ncbi:MAG: ABC transporter permease [Lachnospiraceae bacterium]|nr:ABC transporter permease [Lachnospiraceae bacterium]